MGFSGWTHIKVANITGETDKAFLCKFPSKKEVWIPKSMISDSDDYTKGDGPLELSVKDWFAEKEELA